MSLAVSCLMLFACSAAATSYQRPLPEGFQWQPGGVCWNASLSGSESLRGRHLLISTDTWAPYSFKRNSSGAVEWHGHEIDLLDELAEMLGFTYSINDLDPHYATHGPDVTDGTYTPLLNLAADISDLVVRNWDPVADRRKTLSFLRSLHQSHRLLVLKTPEVIVESSFWDHVSTLVKPFSNRLWGLIAFLFAFNAVTLYLLEWDQYDFKDERSSIGGLCHSLYLSIMLLTGAGAHNASSLIGRFFCGIWGLTLLLLVAWYTADLASNRTLSRVSETTFESLAQMKAEGRTACAAADDLLLGRYQRVHPDLRLRVVEDDPTDSTLESYDRMFHLMESGDCDGLLVDISHPTALRWFQSLDATCKIKIAEIVQVWYGSWVTNKHSACVEQTISYGLQKLDDRGVLDQVRSKYFGAPKLCPKQDTFGTPDAIGIADLSGIFTIYFSLGTICLIAAFIKKNPRLFHPSLHPRGTHIGDCEDNGNNALLAKEINERFDNLEKMLQVQHLNNGQSSAALASDAAFAAATAGDAAEAPTGKCEEEPQPTAESTGSEADDSKARTSDGHGTADAAPSKSSPVSGASANWSPETCRDIHFCSTSVNAEIDSRAKNASAIRQRHSL